MATVEDLEQKIMAVKTPDEAQDVLDLIVEWIEDEEPAQDDWFRIAYQADSLVLLVDDDESYVEPAAYF